MKKLIFIIYMLFDSFVFLVSVGVLITSFVLPRITIFLAIPVVLYLSINSLAGIVLSKKRHLEDKEFEISNNWFLMIYIVNVISIFCTFMPFCQSLEALKHKNFDYFIAASAIFFCIIILIAGQVKWQRMILDFALPCPLKRCICITNPVRVCLIILYLQAITIPVI